MSFYNTIHEKGKTLKESKVKAKTQEDILLDFFKEHSDKSFTPFDIVYNEVFERSVPITSIRRAITNLTEQGFLEKCFEQREGGYGKMNYTWKLATKKNEEFQGRLF